MESQKGHMAPKSVVQGESSVSFHGSHSCAHIQRQLLGSRGVLGLPDVVAVTLLFTGHVQEEVAPWTKTPGPDSRWLPSLSR